MEFLKLLSNLVIILAAFTTWLIDGDFATAKILFSIALAVFIFRGKYF